MSEQYSAARFVVVVKRGTFTSLLQAARYAESIKRHDPDNVIAVEVIPTHVNRGMLDRARAE